MDNKTENDIILYTPEDLQNIFKCSKNHAYQIMHSKTFPSIQINRRLYITKENLTKWLSQNSNRKVNI